MRLSDIITIYLAIGAPFAVHFILHNKEKSPKAFWKAVGVMFIFPFILIRHFLSKRLKREHKNHNEKLEQTKRSAFAALNEIQDRSKGIKESKSIERLIFVIRENVEKYSGLSLVAEQVDESDEPSKHEKEVFRISGCESGELKNAACCLHRRNVRQIISQRNRARKDLLHTLSEIEEVMDESKALLMDSSLSRQINEPLSRLYKNAIEVFLQIEDENAAEIVTRLMNKTLSRTEKDGEVLGEEKCLRTVRPRHAQASQQQTTLTQG